MNEHDIALILFESIKPELTKLVEEAVLSTLSKTPHRRPERVGVTEASEITGYTKNSLYQMHSKGKIPGAIKVGGKLMFRTKELEKWTEDGGPSGQNL